MANKNTIKIVEVESIGINKLKSLFGKGRFASVEFVKKSDGKDRVLNGKLLVKAGLVGGEASYDAESRGQVRIFDINKKNADGKRVGRYTAVTTDNIKWVQSQGVKYVVTGNKEPVLNFIQSIIYNHVNKLLRLTLNGNVYAYFNVPREVHIGLVNSPNKGNFFNTNIKDKFYFTKVGK
jgi:hypothetical protein